MAQPDLSQELSRLRIDKSRKRPRRALRGWVMLLTVLAAGAGGYVYFHKMHAARPVTVARAALSSAVVPNAPILTAGGYIIPRNKIEVSSKVIGRVQEIFVDRGDKVQAGTVLIRIEDAEYQAQVNQAKASLAAAQARLAELLAGSRPEQIQAAQAAMNAAQATLKNAQSDLKRLEGLGEDETISRQALDRARMEVNVAAANLESALKQYELVRKGPRKEEIDAARAQVALAQANVEYAGTQLDYTVIRAPIDGTILEKLAEKGEMVTFQNFGGTRGAKTSVLSMADLGDLQVEIDLNENDLSKVHKGQAAEIRLDSAPDLVLKGQVDEIAPEADRQKATVQVKVAIKNPNGAVRPEVNARVTFLESANPGPANPGTPRVYIPRAALAGSAESARVFVVQGGIALIQTIKLGSEGSLGVQVDEGLKGGEMVVLNPPADLKNGAKVKVVSEQTGGTATKAEARTPNNEHE